MLWYDSVLSGHKGNKNKSRLGLSIVYGLRIWLGLDAIYAVSIQ